MRNVCFQVAPALLPPTTPPLPAPRAAPFLILLSCFPALPCTHLGAVLAKALPATGAAAAAASPAAGQLFVMGPLALQQQALPWLNGVWLACMAGLWGIGVVLLRAQHADSSGQEGRSGGGGRGPAGDEADGMLMGTSGLWGSSEGACYLRGLLFHSWQVDAASDTCSILTMCGPLHNLATVAGGFSGGRALLHHLLSISYLWGAWRGGCPVSTSRSSLACDL